MYGGANRRTYGQASSSGSGYGSGTVNNNRTGVNEQPDRNKARE